MLSHLSASQLSALALGPSHTVLPSARHQVHQLRFPATSVSYSFGPSSTSLLGGVSQMKILSRTPPLGVPSGPPAVPSAPSGCLAGRAKAFSHPALPNLASFPSIKPSCPVCAVISALNTCSFHVAWSLQLVPRACRAGKPPLTSLPVHDSPNLGEVPFFTPVSSRRIPKVFSFVIPLGISFSYLLYWKIRVGTNCSESSLAFERKRNLLTHKELTAEGG